MFDKNMLDELSKLKNQNDKIKPPKQETSTKEEKASIDEESYSYEEENEDGSDIEYEVIPDNFEDEESNQFEYEKLEQEKAYNDSNRQGLETLSNFMAESMNNKKSLDPKNYINEIISKEDYSTDESEAKTIMRGKAKTFIDKEGNEIKSRFVDESGNLNVVYGEPGKNIINRKSVEERRFENKMEALSGLISRFKTAEELEEEEQEEGVIQLDEKPLHLRKDLKRIDQVISITTDLEIKINLVKDILKGLVERVQKDAGLPNIELDITNIENVRTFFVENKNIDPMDIARIFTLSLFLETPEKFPTEDTFDQVQYKTYQVGAKCKAIELKKLITYLSSDSEFHRTLGLISALSKNTNVDFYAVYKMFNDKCEDVLKILLIKYFKKVTEDLLAKVSVLSIKQHTQFKYRSLESSRNLLNSLKTKRKILPVNLKEQIERVNQQILDTQKKVDDIKKQIDFLEKDITMMLILYFGVKQGGYTKYYFEHLPKSSIQKHLLEYGLDAESSVVLNLLKDGIKEKDLNEILKNR